MKVIILKLFKKKNENFYFIPNFIFMISIVTSLKPKGDRVDGEKFLQIMLERQKQLKLRYKKRFCFSYSKFFY